MDEEHFADGAQIADRIRQGNIHAFKQLYRSVFPDLTRFAFGVLRNKALAEEMAQETLAHLWEIRQSLNIHSSLNAYLFKAIRNRCIDHLRHQRIMDQYNNSFSSTTLLAVDNTEQYLAFQQLEQALLHALETLPAEMASAFRKNRFESKSYETIAQEEGVSVRTVEYRISKALTILRQHLHDFKD